MNSGSPFFEQRQSGCQPGSREFAFLLGICLLVGCHHPQPARAISKVPETPDGAAVRGSSAQADVAKTAPALAELAAGESPAPSQLPEAAWFELSLPDFEPALLWYRKGAPLFVVTHGAGGQAAWHCQHFHRLLDGRASLLCPQGKRLYAKEPAQGFYYPDHLALQREVLGAIERFETLVAPPDASRPYVYAGYSQGATMGALAFAQQGKLFSELVLVEGGFADWSQALVDQFRKSGGKAVLFVCGTKHCATKADSAVLRLTRSGLRAKLARANGAGHVPNGAVGQALSSSLGFVLEGDPRWQGFTPTPED